MGRAGSELLARDFTTRRPYTEEGEAEYRLGAVGSRARGGGHHSDRAARLLARLRFAVRRAGGGAATYSVFNAVYHRARRESHLLRAMPTVARALKSTAVSAMKGGSSGAQGVVEAIAAGTREGLATESGHRCVWLPKGAHAPPSPFSS